MCILSQLNVGTAKNDFLFSHPFTCLPVCDAAGFRRLVSTRMGWSHLLAPGLPGDNHQGLLPLLHLWLQSQRYGLCTQPTQPTQRSTVFVWVTEEMDRGQGILLSPLSYEIEKASNQSLTASGSSTWLLILWAGSEMDKYGNRILGGKTLGRKMGPTQYVNHKCKFPFKNNIVLYIYCMYIMYIYINNIFL